MEMQLVISAVSELYGHVSSLGVRASLFIFITTSLHHFSLSHNAFVFVIRLSLCACYAVGWWSTVPGRINKHGHLFTDLHLQSKNNTQDLFQYSEAQFHKDFSAGSTQRRQLLAARIISVS